MVTFSSFLPFAYPFMYIFSSFSANTLLVHKFNFLHFLLRVPAVIVSFFFCTVLQLFALVLCFGDQVLSPGSSLATDFFWSGSIVASGTGKIFSSPDMSPMFNCVHCVPF